MLHNWQNVGRQKGKFRDAKLDKDVIPAPMPTEEEKTIHLCPNGCGETEGNLHYVHCQEKSAIKKRGEARARFGNKLKKIRTDEGIISTATYVLTKIGRNKTISIDGSDLREGNRTKLRKVLDGQHKIGWREMIQGFIYKGWADHQDTHYRHLGLNNRYYNKKRWKRIFLESLLEYGNECWKERNNAIHGDTIKDGRVLRLERLKNQVKELYKRKK